MSPLPFQASPLRRVAPRPATVLLTLGLWLLCGPIRAEIVSETLLFLEPDGRNYLLQRSLRSDAGLRRLHVAKNVRLGDFSYIDPNRYQWDDSAAEVNTLSFHQGDFVVIYPGRFPDRQLRAQEDGSWVYQSWDGTIRPDGHFGIWNEPGDFDRFVYAWILPPNLELLDHQSNQPGEWVRRNHALSFFAERVNDLSFRIRYRERDSDGDTVSDRLDRCPKTPAGTIVGANGCERDDDADGIVNALDRCARTRPGALVDAAGCEADSDGDGVLDSADQCPESGPGARVDPIGCALDLDRDRVPDHLDRCPDSVAGVEVDALGCALDSDADGVPDHLDRCAATPAATEVDPQGCPLDGDGDGVIDTLDRCPQTDPSARVDRLGCELDSDADGVVDRLDRCASTAGDTLVDEQGCATDLDRDGVPDRRDLCPDTLTGAAVDPAGCEIDCDGDGLINSLDRCPNTAYGTPVDAHGCPLDGDSDGIADNLDRCPQTPPGSPVDAVGCALDSDGDGVSDRLDTCPATPTGMAVNTDGCPFDSDLDGVLDNRDLCPDSARDAQVDATGCAPLAPIRLEGVGFVTDSAELTGESERILVRVALILRGHPGLRLEVAGHTDNLGEHDYNMALSQNRAEAVRAFLIGRGVEAGRLTARGYGEGQPLASNNSDLGRAANRRVELQRRGEIP